jgi:hypothetical protein
MTAYKSRNGSGLWARRRLEILQAVERLGDRAERQAVLDAVSGLDVFTAKGPQESDLKPPEYYFDQALRKCKAKDWEFVATVGEVLTLTEIGREEVIHASGGPRRTL